jgi:predicted transcriptional regulator
MPRKPSKILNDKELAIMNVMWKLGEASVKDIQKQLPGDQHYNSVLTIIRVLEQKGHLKHREIGRSFIYKAAENAAKTRGHVLNYLVREVFGGSAASVVLHLVEAGELNREDLDTIRRKIKAAEKKKGEK